MEEFILALSANGIRIANLLSEEVSLGNYLRWRLSGRPGLNYRRHPDIPMVNNLCVHPFPLRWHSAPTQARLEHILRKAIQVMERYIAQNGKPDLIFHHGVFDYTYLTRALSSHFGIPYWYKEHSSYISDDCMPCTNDFETTASLKTFVQGAERCFAPSAHYAQELGRIFSKPFEVLHNYLGPEHFEVSSQRPAYPPFELLNVAIMTPVKNQQLLIKAFSRAVHQYGLHARLTIAGDGGLRDTLLHLGTSLKLGNKLRIMQFQNRERIRQLLDHSHAFVLSSSRETFGLVLIEAMARGLPVISSRIPGPMDIVNAHTGILFESENEAALTEAIMQMAARYTEFDPLRISKYVSDTYGPEALWKRLFEKGWRHAAQTRV